MLKMHNINFSVCNKSFENRENLQNHKSQTHKEAEIPVLKNIFKLQMSSKPQEEKIEIKQTNMLNKHICKQCKTSFRENLELLEHIKNKHIHDTWPDSGSKRDVSMIKTSSIHEPRKKKTAEEEDMHERSRHMDRKILEKQKKEEVEEIERQKELEERRQAEEQKNE